MPSRFLKRLSKVSKYIESLPIFVRRSFFLSLDLLILITSVFLTCNVLEIPLFTFPNQLIFYLIVILVGISLYLFSGQYKGVTRYKGSYSIYYLLIRNSLIILVTYFISLIHISQNININYTFWLLLWLLINFFTVGIRTILRDLLLYFRIYMPNKISVLIYGAGDAGSQLAKSLIISGKYKVLAFIDDNDELLGRNIFGIKIISPKNIYKYKKIINQILIAIPSLSVNRKKEIFNNIYCKEYKVLQVPSLEDITSGKLYIDNLKPITIEDLLGREKAIREDIVSQSDISNNVIFVSGAGGSIGSELCKQIISLNPKKLILLDNSEENLYYLNNELSENYNNFLPLLGDACNYELLKKIFNENLVNIVFHAAAYKHVPLVETNPIVGLKNNVIASYSLCRACMDSSVSKAILISSDKAVRPTNLMGVSKRISELIFQSYASKNNSKSLNSYKYEKVFTMVRFGNVLGSSGSVIPLFKKQINNGGPVTITHPDIQRYFMTLPEASKLVLHSAQMARGGEIFLLDMGAPIKIVELAKQMIKLSGLSLKDENNLSGDIKIEYTGLRPGEKLYEELLISGESIKTIHPQIFCAKEDYIKPEILFPEIDYLIEKLNEFDINETFRVLSLLVPEWKRN